MSIDVFPAVQTIPPITGAPIGAAAPLVPPRVFRVNVGITSAVVRLVAVPLMMVAVVPAVVPAVAAVPAVGLAPAVRAAVPAAPSAAGIAGLGRVPAPLADTPPAEPRTKAPVLEDIPIGTATAAR